jgi:ABC-type nitrate/sulfonate/bicarbonate transport system ATPase subunit
MRTLPAVANEREARPPDSAGHIVVRDLTHTFRGRRRVEALERVSIEAEPGAFVSLLGPSGCGKSTLLRILAGLLIPDAGTATVGGAAAIGRPGLVAYMPQKDLLFPWRRVLGNAMTGAEIAGVPRAEARRQAEALIERFGLAGFEGAWPSELSGGMRQRLALLRTFLIPRQTLLLDEPFGALDAITRREMHSWLQEVWLRDRRTVLFVTHDVEEALLLSDRVYVMSARPGRIAAEVPVAFAHPRPSGLVVTPDFVALKARLLAALEGGR